MATTSRTMWLSPHIYLFFDDGLKYFENVLCEVLTLLPLFKMRCGTTYDIEAIQTRQNSDLSKMILETSLGT